MISLNIIGLDETLAKFKQMPVKLQQETEAILENGAKLFVIGAKRDAPKDFGRLGQNVSYKPLGQLLFEVVAQSEYAAYMEFGTKSRFRAIPGVDASEFKTITRGSGEGFYDAILRWVKRKGITGTYSVKTGKRTGGKIDQQIEDEQTAFAIYLSILRHGVKPHPFFFKQQPEVKKYIETALQNMVNELAA